MKYSFLPLCLLVLLLSACEREDRFGSALPVIFQIDQLQLRGGDTITITGNNFSENPANNLVTFNGTQALIVSSSFRDLVVIVPDRAGAGQLVVTTRAGRSNEFPYRYTYQVTGVNTLDLNVESVNFRKMKIINNQIFLISNFNEPFPDPSFTKIYRFRLDGSAVPEGPNPLQINNFNVGAIAGDAQGNVVVSAQNKLEIPALKDDEARLYSLTLTQGTLNILPNTSKVLAVVGEYYPEFAPFSDITFDSQGNLCYVEVDSPNGSLIRRNLEGQENILIRDFGAYLNGIQSSLQGEIFLGIPNPLLASVSPQGNISLLLFPNDFPSSGELSITLNERSNDLLLAYGSSIFSFNRATRRLENLAILPQSIRSVALSEDGRLFVLTESSEVQEVIFK